MKPKGIINFSIKELVPKVVYVRYGNRAGKFLDYRMLANLQYIRTHLGRSMTVNNWHKGGRFSFRGLDPSKRNGGYRNYYSPHTLGRGFDFDVKGMTVSQTHDWIRQNYLNFPYPDGLRMERYKKGKLVTGNHLDNMNYGVRKSLYFFNV